MIKKLLSVGAVAAALLVFAHPAAQADSATDRATGGGQILVSSDGKGAGDTIAFTAQNRAGDDATAAIGQVQYVDRTGGTGVGQTVVHGVVSCLAVNGNTAKLAGTWNDGSGAFTMVIEDNGEGAQATGADMIALNNTSDPTCKRENGDDNGNTALARGNAQVYDAP
jgi:hypothetical protein